MARTLADLAGDAKTGPGVVAEALAFQGFGDRGAG
jgi:hypothetical protein